MATIVMAPSLVKEAGDTSIVGTKRVCFDKGSRMNECGNSMPPQQRAEFT